MIALEQKVGTFVAPRSYKSLGGKSFYTRRTFSSCRTLPYLEYWIGKWRLQCGWISCGRFQVQFRRLG
jgi:hypothetical protein